MKAHFYFKRIWSTIWRWKLFNIEERLLPTNAFNIEAVVEVRTSYFLIS